MPRAPNVMAKLFFVFRIVKIPGWLTISGEFSRRRRNPARGARLPLFLRCIQTLANSRHLRHLMFELALCWFLAQFLLRRPKFPASRQRPSLRFRFSRSSVPPPQNGESSSLADSLASKTDQGLCPFTDPEPSLVPFS